MCVYAADEQSTSQEGSWCLGWCQAGWGETGCSDIPSRVRFPSDWPRRCALGPGSPDSEWAVPEDSLEVPSHALAIGNGSERICERPFGKPRRPWAVFRVEGSGGWLCDLVGSTLCFWLCLLSIRLLNVLKARCGF